MTLLGIGYLPTVNVWAMSYLLGPGIILGGGVVTPANASPGFSTYPHWHHNLFLVATRALDGTRRLRCNRTFIYC
jgi:hypothetical protein